MSNKIAKKELLTLERVVLAGGVVALVVFLLIQLQHPSQKTAPEMKALSQAIMKQNYADFATWQKQTTFSFFNFYLPQSLQVKMIEKDQTYDIVENEKKDTSLISIHQLSYKDFQAEKLALDQQGLKQYGWTNAYGASVFEYKTDLLTTFVVDKEKKTVLKLFTTDTNNFNLLENITRTFQTTAKETDLHGPWYVDFKGKYKIRYASDLELQTESPFGETSEWKVKFKDKQKTGRIRLTSSSQVPDGGVPETIKKISVDGVEASLYQYDETNSGIVWQKGDRYYVLLASGDSQQTSKTLNMLMEQMLASFRFLTVQESLQ